MNKGEKREKIRLNQRKMIVSNRNIFNLVRIKRKKIESINKLTKKIYD